MLAGMLLVAKIDAQHRSNASIEFHTAQLKLVLDALIIVGVVAIVPDIEQTSREVEKSLLATRYSHISAAENTEENQHMISNRQGENTVCYFSKNQ